VSGAPSIDPLYRSFLTQLTLYTGDSAIPGTCVSNGQTSPYNTSLIEVSWAATATASLGC